MHVNPTQRGQLQAHPRKRNLPAGAAQSERIVPLLDEGCGDKEISELSWAALIRQRLAEAPGLDKLHSAPRGTGRSER